MRRQGSETLLSLRELPLPAAAGRDVQTLGTIGGLPSERPPVKSSYTPRRTTLLLVVLLGLVHRHRSYEASRGRELPQRDPAPEPGTAEAAEAGAGGAGEEAPRSFLAPGSLYQNAKMTLWNVNGVPISVTMRVRDGDGFELSIRNLNSVGGGHAAWLALRGLFYTVPLQGAPGHVRLVPEVEAGTEALNYDASLFDGATAFGLRCLTHVGSAGLLHAVDLKVDTSEDAIHVTPKAAALRVLWNQPVTLRLTSEEELWEPTVEEEQTPQGSPAHLAGS